MSVVIMQEMRPYAHDSMVRLKHYCDVVGVTDRYTGYRNNLNRGNRDPINLAFSWFDPAGKHPSTHIKLRKEADKVHHRLECLGKCWQFFSCLSAGIYMPLFNNSAGTD